MKPANDAEPNSLPRSQEPKSDSEHDLAGLLAKLDQLTDALVQQTEAISQLAISNEALADSVTSQPDEGEEAEQGYLS